MKFAAHEDFGAPMVMLFLKLQLRSQSVYKRYPNLISDRVSRRQSGSQPSITASVEQLITVSTHTWQVGKGLGCSGDLLLHINTANFFCSASSPMTNVASKGRTIQYL